MLRLQLEDSVSLPPRPSFEPHLNLIFHEIRQPTRLLYSRQVNRRDKNYSYLLFFVTFSTVPLFLHLKSNSVFYSSLKFFILPPPSVQIISGIFFCPWIADADPFESETVDFLLLIGCSFFQEVISTLILLSQILFCLFIFTLMCPFSFCALLCFTPRRAPHAHTRTQAHTYKHGRSLWVSACQGSRCHVIVCITCSIPSV